MSWLCKVSGNGLISSHAETGSGTVDDKLCLPANGPLSNATSSTFNSKNQIKGDCEIQKLYTLDCCQC